ncbi:hypothetical protein Syun_006044 [Stephania yunnanensis]|uniref:Uncharacterized protein n=1 Tax=Stephania yunnanensis TaxID=152371 RepID=A0AAP0KVW1_9MAGN
MRLIDDEEEFIGEIVPTFGNQSEFEDLFDGKARDLGELEMLATPWGRARIWCDDIIIIISFHSICASSSSSRKLSFYLSGSPPIAQIQAPEPLLTKSFLPLSITTHPPFRPKSKYSLELLECIATQLEAVDLSSVKKKDKAPLMNARLVVELGVGLEANRKKGFRGDGEEGRIAREEVAKVIRVVTFCSQPVLIRNMHKSVRPIDYLTYVNNPYNLPPGTTSPHNYANTSANANTPSISPSPPPNAPFDNTTINASKNTSPPHSSPQKTAPLRPPPAPYSTTPPPSSNTSPPPSPPPKNCSTNALLTPPFPSLGPGVAQVGVVTVVERGPKVVEGRHRRWWPLEPQGGREGRDFLRGFALKNLYGWFWYELSANILKKKEKEKTFLLLENLT